MLEISSNPLLLIHPWVPSKLNPFSIQWRLHCLRCGVGCHQLARAAAKPGLLWGLSCRSPQTLMISFCLVSPVSAFVSPSLPARLRAEPQQHQAELDSSPGSHPIPGALLCSPRWSRGLYHRGKVHKNNDNISFSASGLSWVLALTFVNCYHVFLFLFFLKVSALLPATSFMEDYFF